MKFPVIKGSSYALIHTPELLLQQVDSKNLSLDNEISTHLRSFASTVGYPPNQAFIGNILPEDLPFTARPWYKNLLTNSKRQGKYGEIFPEDEFLGVMKAVDVFGLVCLEAGFQQAVMKKLNSHPALRTLKGVNAPPQDIGYHLADIRQMVDSGNAIPISFAGKIIGCVRHGHGSDPVLKAPVVAENLVAKASAVIALQLLYLKAGLDPQDVDYVLEASEEACGDIRQKGGGSFAKSIAEACSCQNATGADTRAFCAAPVHAIMQGSALVQAGIFKNVVVVGGGCSAKLGLNADIHLGKEMPILEDMLGAFAFHISEDDGFSPILRTDLIGMMNVACGDSPQMVFKALVADPLAKGGYNITDIDRFAAELVNPEIIEATGCGDVARMNYQMIASLAVLQGEIKRTEIEEQISRTEIEEQISRFGVPGFAPNQGHIPSGVPYIGPACDLIVQGKANKVMIIGKGSLFLGKLTQLYDAVSLIIQNNPHNPLRINEV